MKFTTKSFLAAAMFGGAAMAASASAQQVFVTNVIIQGSLCVGVDCSSSENFGFDTVRLKENNLRVHFDDTSNSGSFPSNDWRIIVNDSTNGGANYFRIEDSTANRAVMEIRSGSQANAIFVNGSNVGLGTASPVVELHITDGDSPTMRLEQDGSAGFQAQTWDVAGNETNFFVRDVTNGSALPFRIFPGNVNDDALVIRNGRVGIGTDNPAVELDVRNPTGDPRIRLVGSLGTWEYAVRAADGEFALNDISTPGGDFIFASGDADANVPWEFIHRADEGLAINSDTTPGMADFVIAANTGNVTVLGTLTTGGPTCGGGCDAVFDTDYNLPTIGEHAVAMFENRHLPAVGPTSPDAPVNLTEHVGNMLNELEKAHIYIAELDARNKMLEERLADLEAKVSSE